MRRSKSIGSREVANFVIYYSNAWLTNKYQPRPNGRGLHGSYTPGNASGVLELKEICDYLRPCQKAVPGMRSRILKIEDDLRHSEPIQSVFIVNSHKKRRKTRNSRSGTDCERCNRRGHLVGGRRTGPESFLKAQDKSPWSSSKKLYETSHPDQSFAQEDKVVMMTASTNHDTTLSHPNHLEGLLL